MRIFIRLLILLTLLLAACSSSQDPSSSPSLAGIHPTSTIPDVPTRSPSPTPTETLLPTSTFTNTPSPVPTPSTVTFMAVGDIMLGRTVGDRILNEGPGTVFTGVQTILSLADILAGNLECAITDRGQAVKKSYTLAAPPLSAQTLGLAGFDLLNLGNNHSLDHGQEGLLQTQELLTSQGITTVGVGLADNAAGPVFFEKNGVRIAFLSYVDVPREYQGFDTRAWIATDTVPGISWADKDDIQRQVTLAKQEADVVIVFMHFGFEANGLPVHEQRDVAVVAVDAGASAVIGTHPHLLQHVEEYHGALIAYSLGNFVFDDFDMPENRSAILRLILDQDGMVSYDWFPVVIHNGLPIMASQEQAAEILRMLAP